MDTVKKDTVSITRWANNGTKFAVEVRTGLKIVDPSPGVDPARLHPRQLRLAGSVPGGAARLRSQRRSIAKPVDSGLELRGSLSISFIRAATEDADRPSKSNRS